MAHWSNITFYMKLSISCLLLNFIVENRSAIFLARLDGSADLIQTLFSFIRTANRLVSHDEFAIINLVKFKIETILGRKT